MHYLFREHWGILGVSPFCCSCCVSFCLSQITELQTAAFLRENGELGNGSVFITALWESFVKACMPLSPFASCSQRIDMIILWYFEITKVFFSLWQETLAPSWHQKDKLILQFLFFFFLIDSDQRLMKGDDIRGVSVEPQLKPQRFSFSSFKFQTNVGIDSTKLIQLIIIERFFAPNVRQGTVCVAILKLRSQQNMLAYSSFGISSFQCHCQTTEPNHEDSLYFDVKYLRSSRS